MSSIIMITGNNISNRDTSHDGGYAKTYAEALGATVIYRPEEFDKLPEGDVYLYHGGNQREQPKGLNFTGGFSTKNDYGIRLIIKAIKNGQKIHSLKYEMLDVADKIGRRKDVSDELKALANSVSWEADCIRQVDLKGFTKIAIGNSHTPSFSDKESLVVKTDGTTLNSQINSNFQYVKDYLNIFWKNNGFPKKVTMTFMDIDVRFYLLNKKKFVILPDWKDQIREWIRFAQELHAKGIEKIELCAPLPIETEERKHPKTGAYPKNSEIYFYGSQEERANLVKEIKSYMYLCTKGKPFIDIVQVPEFWYELPPLEYEREYMERPRSVHLAPKHYRRNSDWTSKPDLFA